MSFIKKHPILMHILLLSVLFAGGHIAALYFSLYWTTNWADIIMHLFGGFLGSLMVLYVLSKIGISPQTLVFRFVLFVFVVMSVFVVAIMWELWEIFVGFIDPFEDFVDSIIDIFMGVLGAKIGFIYYDKKLRTKTK